MRSEALAFPVAGPLAGRCDGGPTGRPLPLWRADRLDDAARGAAARPTGHAALDAELPGGGWPAAGLTELLLAAPGCGELRLLAPALAGGSTLWVAPPLTPYAPALAAIGFALDRLVLLTPSLAADAAWAAEQALRSGTLAAVLWWEPASQAVAATALRRLHLAAEEGRTPLFALRSLRAREQPSPAPLRLALAPAGPTALELEIVKRRGPPRAAPLRLALPGPALSQRARRMLAPASAAVARAPAARQQEETRDAVVRPAPERAAA